jgi:hypothetical protein
MGRLLTLPYLQTLAGKVCKDKHSSLVGTLISCEEKCYKTFFLFTDDKPKHANVFVPGKLFKASIAH